MEDYFAEEISERGYSKGMFWRLLSTYARTFDHRCIALLYLLGKRRKEVAKMNLTEIMAFEADTILVRHHYAGAVRHCRPADRRVIVE